MKITSDESNGTVTVNKTTVTADDGKQTSSRYIVFLDEVVIKFDSDREYYGKQCTAEGLLYNRINANDKKYFASVRAFGDSFCVMDRIDFYRPNSDDITDKQLKTAKRIIERLTDKYNLTDLHDDNWGIEKSTGKLIIFDYVSSGDFEKYN